MYTFSMNTRLFIVAILLVLFVSCSRDGDTNLEREDLFSLDYGKMEDQLDLVQEEGTPFDTSTDLVMRDGFFFILNRTSGKLMKFNSYGDIVELYYNADRNPEPVLLKRESGEGVQSTRRAFAYPFQDIRTFAVNADETLLVDDRVPESRREYDDEMEALLDRIVLLFDREGNLVNYIGQEGLGGTPFPFIQRIDVNNRNEIIVIARGITTWRVFWFNAAGKLLSTVTIPLDTLPAPEDTDYTVSLESVFPDTRARSLYLKVDYYGELETDDAEAGYGYISSALLVLNAETGLYIDSVDIPVHYRESEEPAGFARERRKMMYELLGVAEGQVFFFMSPDDGPYYQLLLLDRTGAVLKRVRIELADGSLYFRDMHVNPEGILSALLCVEGGARVVWWRSDRFIPGVDE